MNIGASALSWAEPSFPSGEAMNKGKHFGVPLPPAGVIVPAVQGVDGISVESGAGVAAMMETGAAPKSCHGAVFRKRIAGLAAQAGTRSN